MRSAFAVLRLITNSNSNLVGCSTGKGAADLTPWFSSSRTLAGARDRLQDARSLAVELGTQQMDNAAQRGTVAHDARANMKPMALVHFTRGPWAAHHVCRN